MPIRSRTNWRVQGPLLAFLLVSLALAFVVFRYFLLTFAVAGSVACDGSPSSAGARGVRASSQAASAARTDRASTWR